jgi:hypothetical protein
MKFVLKRKKGLSTATQELSRGGGDPSRGRSTFVVIQRERSARWSH